MEDQNLQQEVLEPKQNIGKVLWQKLSFEFQQGRLQEVGQKKMRESEKKRLMKKQRQMKFSNLQERRQDVVFDCLQFIGVLRRKLERDKQEQIQIEYMRNAQTQRPRNNQMISKYNQMSQNQKETYENTNEDYTDIENYLDYQQQKNILDRLEKKELSLLCGNEQNNSLSFSQSINLAFTSVLPSQKRVFPFENYIPNFKENDLNQLNFESQCTDIDGDVQSFNQEILCFTQYNDQLFGFALSNGIIIIKDIFSQKIYEVICFATYCISHPKHAKVQDIVCLQFTPDLRHIIACHRTGAISMYDFKYNKMVYYIKNLFRYGSSEVEEMNQSNLFIIDFKLIAQISAKDEVYIVALNAKGDSALIKIFKGFLSYEQQVVFLMKNELFPLCQINILSRIMQEKYFQYDYDREDDFIVGFSSPEKLYVVRIRLQKMKAKLMFKYIEQKMDTIFKKVKNSFLWSEIKLGKENQLMFLASFTNFLYVGILSKQQEESIKDHGKMKIRNKYSFDLKKKIKHYTSIKFIGSLYKNIVLICDNNDQLFLINTTDFRSCFVKMINLSIINSFKMKLPEIDIKPTLYELDSYQLKAQKTVKSQQENTLTKQSSSKEQDQIMLKTITVMKSNSVNNQQIETIPNESKTQITYSNSFSFSVMQQKCYILLKNKNTEKTQSQFACINLVSWRASLEEFIKQGEYLNAMSFLHIIYSGYHKFAHNGLQKFDLKDLLIPQIERTALNYTDKLLKQLKEEQVSQNFGQSSFSVREEKSSHSSLASLQIVSSQSNQSAFCDIHFLSEHDRLIFAMEFLVSCQLQDIIFYDIRQNCSKLLGSMDFFIECLEPFILEGKITNIHNDIITDIIDYYQSRGNLKIIQQILTSLDLQNLDIKPLVQLSLEKQLITALIYLSTRSIIPDFISPLMIFWNQFVASLRKWEEKNKGKSKSFIMDSSPLNPEDKGNTSYDPSASIIRELDVDENDFLKEQLLLSLLQDPLKIKCEYFGLRALWYFRLCIQQKLIDGEYINDSDYKQVILSFESWISFPQNIKVCLSRWPQAFFQVLAAFFTEKPLKIIDEDKNKLKQIVKDLNVQELWESTAEFITNKKVFYSQVLLRQIISITLEIDSQFNFVTRSTIPRNAYDDYGQNQKSLNLNNEQDAVDEQDLTAYQLLIEKANPSEFDGRLNMRRSNLLSSFYLFLSNMIYQSQCSYSSNYLVGLFKFKKQKVVEIVFYLAQYPKTLDKLEFPQEELQKQAKIYSEGRDDKVDFKELAQLLRSEFILNLIKYILDVIGNDNSQMQLLSQLLDVTEFATARSHILFLRGHYHRAIDSYIQSSNKTMSRLIFDWMWQNLTESRSEDPKKYELLKEIMRVKLPDFIKIDSERTHQLFQKFLNDAEHDIISQLENNPNLQLIYIQNVIKQYKLKIKSNPQLVETLKVDKGILILNIKLMCQLNKPEDDVLNEITSLDFYPFEDILKISLDKQYLEVCTFIYLRMGLQEQALKAQIKMLDNTLFQYKKYLEDFYHRMQNVPSNTFMTSTLNVFVNDFMGRNQSTHFDNSDNNEEGDLQTRQPGNSISIQRTESTTYNQSFNMTDMNQMQLNASASNEKIQQFTKQINSRMQRMFDICSIHKQTDNSDTWFLLLDLLVQSCKKLADIETKDSLKNLRKIFSQSIGNTIMQIADNVDMDKFLEKLRSSYSDISITDLKDTFKQLLQNSIDSYQVLYNCLVYIQQDLTNQMQAGSENFLKGTFSFSHCSTCFDQLNSMDKVKRKIRKQIILKSEKQASAVANANSSISTQESDDQNQSNEEDEDIGQIIIFNCGHSYHKECYFRQKNLRICLECIRAKNQLYFLIISRQDVDINKLNLFIRKQLELLQEKLEQNRRSSELSLNRSSSYFDTVKSVIDEEAKEIKKFNKLRRMKKLQNFDRMVESKYSLFEKDPVIKKNKHTS